MDNISHAISPLPPSHASNNDTESVYGASTGSLSCSPDVPRDVLPVPPLQPLPPPSPISRPTLSEDKYPLDSLTPFLDFPEQILRDTEEQGILPLLELRQLPILTHGIATWNVCNGFIAETIAGIMLKCNFSILLIQEPPRSTFDDTDIGYTKKTLLQYGINGHFSKYQYLLFNERALGGRLSDFIEHLDGRLIACNLQIGPLEENTYLRFRMLCSTTRGP